MKPAFVAAILLAVTVGLSPRCQAKQRAPDVATPAQSKNPIAVSPPVEGQKRAANEKPSNNQSPSGDAPSQRILIIVTVITAGFIGWQAWETRRAATATKNSVEAIQNQTEFLKRQAKATEDAAKATKASSDALIATQRAWLDGEFQPVHDNWGTWNLVAKNHGATPAQLLRHECSFHAEGKEFRWDSYDQKDTWNWGMLLGAGQCSEPLQKITPDNFFDFLRERGMKGAASCTIAVMLAYGDIINPHVEHTTKFLVLYNRVSKTLGRLSQYNEYT